MQLKDFYESEKQRLETKITEERKNNKLRLDQQQEEFDERLKEEQSFHEEEIEMLQEEIKQLEERYKSIIKQAEQDQAISNQKIEFLENSLKEAKEDLVNNQNKCSENLMSRINSLVSNNFVRECNNIKTLYEKELENKKSEYENEKQIFKNQINEMNQEIDRLRSENQELKDDIVKQKLDFTRNEAIINQKIEFKDLKIKELTETNDLLSKQFEEKLKNQKQDLVFELNDKLTKLEIENSKLVDKYESKRKSCKELESEFSRLKADKDRESIIMEQKIYNLENSNKKLIEKYEKELNLIKSESQYKLDEYDNELEILSKENNELKTRLMDTERDISEITSNYERDKALWEDKFDFLENQKQQAKRDLQDAHKKFEMTVEQLRRKDSSDRGKTESAQMLLISSIEKKYKDQIKDMTDSNNQIIQELSIRCKQLEKEYREIQEKYEIETRGKISEYGSMEKKIKEMIENEHRLIDEIKMLKNERDKKMFENQTVLEREKEIYKQRMKEIENKINSSESKRSSMMFEFEKERAKWALEKDKFINEIECLSENLKKATKKRDLLLKENDKLKSEYKSHKKFAHASTIGPGIVNGILSARQVELVKNSNEGIKLSKPGSKMSYIGDYSTIKSRRSSQSKEN